jgi:hypothetical protein
MNASKGNLYAQVGLRQRQARAGEGNLRLCPRDDWWRRCQLRRWTQLTSNELTVFLVQPNVHHHANEKLERLISTGGQTPLPDRLASQPSERPHQEMRAISTSKTIGAPVQCSC